MKKLLNQLFFLIMLSLCVIFTSCNTARIVTIYDSISDEITVRQIFNTHSLNVETNKISFSYKQNTRVISCSYDEQIKVVSSDPSWCTASINKADDNIIMLIQVSRNNGQERTANIKVSVGKTEPAQIEVIQDSGAPVPIEGIPIMAWAGVQEHTIERYRELKEAGIDYNLTVSSAMPNANMMERAMDMAKIAGVRMWLHCPELYNKMESTVNRFKDHPALAGYFIVDEAPPESYQGLGEFIRNIQVLDNKNFCYMNIGPNWRSEEQCRNHVRSFLQQIPASLLSYDDYPIMVDGNGERFLNHRWWVGLKVFSEESKEAGIPWWGFALTAKHTVTWDTPNRVYPMPTLADLRFQVYCYLAYGAQGIQYFTYWNTTLPFGESPIGNDGKKTKIWYTVQQMSREIKGLSGVFLGAQVNKVEHLTITDEGKLGELPISTTRFDFANRPAEAQIITKFTPANGTNAMISFMRNGNRYYMVVINLNLEGGGNMSVTIEGGAGLQLIKKDGTAIPASSESSTQTVTPGDALIYGWDIK